MSESEAMCIQPSQGGQSPQSQRAGKPEESKTQVAERVTGRVLVARMVPAMGRRHVMGNLRGLATMGIVRAWASTGKARHDLAVVLLRGRRRLPSLPALITGTEGW